jgi:hypothetical protein
MHDHVTPVTETSTFEEIVLRSIATNPRLPIEVNVEAGCLLIDLQEARGIWIGDAA